MWPLIAEGDELLIEPRPARVRLGDVAIYRRDRRWVAHRVVGRRSSENQVLFLVKGDHVLDFDPPLAVGRICGRVAAIVTPAGTSDYSYRTWRILNTLAALLSAAIGRTCSLYRALRQMPSRTTAPPTALVALVNEE